jgi:multiple sugar transport system substrate-binding protein
LSPDGSTAHGYIDSDATVEAFQLIMDMYREFHVCRKPDEPSKAGELHQGFALIFAFTWFIGAVEVEGIGEEFDVVGLPQMPGSVQANMVYMGATGITTKCKHPELAWAFLKHHVFERPERFSRPLTLPITRSVAEQSGMTTRRLWSRYLQEMDVVRPSGYYWNEKWNSSRQLINEDIVKMIVDGAEVRQTLKSWTRFA